MKTRTARVTAGLFVGAAFGLTSIGAGPAFATPPAACPEMAAAVLVSGNICQVVVNVEEMSGGLAQYDMPSGITKLSAVLVGGGGGGYSGYEQSYGGGAGEAVADGVSSGTPLSAFTLTVSGGSGGTGAFGGDGEDTEISFDWDGDPVFWNAAGGEGALEIAAGSSGSGKTGASAGGGGGAFGNAESIAGGAGYASFASMATDLGLGAPLWADLSLLSGFSGIGYGGDGQYQDQDDFEFYGPDSPSPRGPGSGGIGTWDESDDDATGMDGFAVIRFAYGEDLGDPAIALSASTVEQSGKVVVTVSGLDPDEADLSAEVHSTPFPLGTTTANGSGVATWTFNVPASFPRGKHTVIVTRGAHGGQQLSLSLVVTGSLAETGAAESAGLGVLAGLIVVSGAGLVLTARRRSSRPLRS